MVPVLARADPGIVALKKGDKAPANGVFYTVDAHAKLVSKIKTTAVAHKNELEYWKKKLKLEMDTALKLKDVDIDILKKKLQLTVDSYNAREKLVLDELKNVRAMSSPWYKSPTFIAITSVVLTIGACALSIWGVSKLTK